KSEYIDAVHFGVLASLSFTDNNPNKIILNQRPGRLDFRKAIEKGSPEYHSLLTCHYITRAIKYYDGLFGGRIDFNSQAGYKTIEVVFGEASLLSSPKKYIEEKGVVVSPSLFYHEIGHRAFWLLEDDLKIKFRGLSVIHMGLLEYFTVSLNDSPLVGEGFLPAKLLRDASHFFRYPPNETYNLDHTFRLLRDSYPQAILDPDSFIARYYQASLSHYGDKLGSRVDNHRGGMVLTSTLWRIRQRLGREKTDRLVAGTILDLNRYLGRRVSFYGVDEAHADQVWWYEVFYGLIDKDRQWNDGANRDVIKGEFARTGYPVERVRLTR
ncbi:MAG TPA: hypothetical protein PKK12_14100, partial [Candidatus Aminicenantes bacterium]|nr:hypothetical protein [Candidatus Aminicenantes bacterium]